MIYEASAKLDGCGAKEKTGRRRPSPLQTRAAQGKPPPASAAAPPLQERILDKLCFAILTLDEARRPLYLNAAASRLLKDSQNSPVLHRGGRVVGRRLQDEEALRLALAEAQRGACGCALLRAEAEEGRVFALKATLLRGAEASRRGEFLLILSNPQIQDSVKASLASLYGLTRAEAHMALLLARGQSLEAAAAACDITLATARTHLKRAFDKTGAHSQSQFVVLIHHLAPVF